VDVIVPAIEEHVDFAARAIEEMRTRGADTFEATREAETVWNGIVTGILSRTVIPQGAEKGSWYMGANIPGKPRAAYLFAGGVPLYRATSLAGLPPALVLGCECDPSRDEAVAYGHALAAAGVPAEVQRLSGFMHAALNMSAFVPRVEEIYETVSTFATQYLGTATG
jgi:acetyl esterase/lipase